MTKTAKALLWNKSIRKHIGFCQGCRLQTGSDIPPDQRRGSPRVYATGKKEASLFRERCVRGAGQTQVLKLNFSFSHLWDNANRKNVHRCRKGEKECGRH